MADVCRPDLLVEIEGIAFSRQAKSAAGKPQPAFSDCSREVAQVS